MIHVHEYQTIHASVVAEYQKGNRENFLAIGEFMKCQCGQGLFVPARKDLAAVCCDELQDDDR